MRKGSKNANRSNNNSAYKRERERERSTILKYSGGKQASSTDTAISDKSILSSSQIRFL